MNWQALYQITVAFVASAMKHEDQLKAIIDAWTDAPPEYSEQRKEALALLSQLRAAKQGALDRADLRDLEAPLDD